MDDEHELGTYRGFRLYVIEDGRRFRGYALRQVVDSSGTTSDDAFTVAGGNFDAVAVRLREIVDREMDAGTSPARAGEVRHRGPLVRSCAWCGRWERDGNWVAQDLDSTVPAAVSHSICPECAEKMLRADRERRQD